MGGQLQCSGGDPMGSGVKEGSSPFVVGVTDVRPQATGNNGTDCVNEG